MSPDETPGPLEGEVTPRPVVRSSSGGAPVDGDPMSGGVSAPMVGVIALAVGLLGGYLIWGQRSAEAKPNLVANTAASTYSAEIDAAPTRIGTVAVRNLKSLEEWDALDPFEGGFPLPPEEWTQPLLALNPPIPVAATVVTTEGSRPSGSGDSGFAPMRTPSIRGNLPNLSPMPAPLLDTEAVPANPGDSGGSGSSQEAPPQTNGAMLITGTLTGVNEKAAQATIAALGAKYGGGARSFTHMGPEGEVEAEGVLLLVAPSDANKALADIRKLGGLIGEDRSEGSARARQGRLNAIFASRLQGLRKRREELLVQFLEDADPIKIIDTAIDREARALSAVRLTGAADRLTAIRILLKP